MLATPFSRPYRASRRQSSVEATARKIVENRRPLYISTRYNAPAVLFPQAKASLPDDMSRQPALELPTTSCSPGIYRAFARFEARCARSWESHRVGGRVSSFPVTSSRGRSIQSIIGRDTSMSRLKEVATQHRRESVAVAAQAACTCHGSDWDLEHDIVFKHGRLARQRTPCD